MAAGNFGARNFLPRHEQKYVISPELYTLLFRRISSLLERDVFSVDWNGYFISSLYLDDVFDTAYNEKLSGSDGRKKYRLRTYNGSDGLIKLECKEKHRGIVVKRSQLVSREDFQCILCGCFDRIDLSGPLSREIYALHREKLLRPAAVVNYIREAYCHPLSSTRITFDKCLTAGYSAASFRGQDTVRGFPYEGFDSDSVILEIKYDNFFPEFLRAALREGLSQKSASKYVICRDALRLYGLRYK